MPGFVIEIPKTPKEPQKDRQVEKGQASWIEIGFGRNACPLLTTSTRKRLSFIEYEHEAAASEAMALIMSAKAGGYLGLDREVTLLAFLA